MRGSRSHAPHPLPAGRKVKRPAHHGSVRTDTKPESRPSTPTERDLVDLVKQLAIREQAITPTSNPAVIKIYATLQEPDYKNPWQMGPVEQATGSGVVVLHKGTKKILTAAHVIADYTYIQVQKTDIDDPELQTAFVYAVTHECDLALLELDKADEAFLDGIEPAELGGLPNLRDKVYVAGFPIGGEELSITEGVVSRIEGQPYAHSMRVLLAVTVDAAINAGNSGGPVFSTDGKLIGIAFQAMVGAENTGHVIPTPVMLHFMEGVAKAKDVDSYFGFPSLGIEIQHLLNPLLRTHLGLTKEQTGVLVTEVLWGNSAFGVLQKGDVLLSLNGKKIANNGTVASRSHRVDFLIDVTLFQCGDTIQFSIVREKKQMEVTVTLLPQYDLVPLAQHDILPQYFIYCGCVFQVLSLDYISNMFSLASAPKELLLLLESGAPSVERTEVVVLSQVLTHTVNSGYDELLHVIISHVNGKSVASLHMLLHEMTTTSKDTIELRTQDNVLILLPGPLTDAAILANAKINQRYRVIADRSPDLLGPYEPADWKTIAVQKKKRQNMRHAADANLIAPAAVVPAPVAQKGK